MSERNYAYINELVPTAQAAVAGDFWGCKQGNPAVFRDHKSTVYKGLHRVTV